MEYTLRAGRQSAQYTTLPLTIVATTFPVNCHPSNGVLRDSDRDLAALKRPALLGRGKACRAALGWTAGDGCSHMSIPHMSIPHMSIGSTAILSCALEFAFELIMARGGGFD